MEATEARFKKVEQLAFDLNAKLPVRIWVEGDGKIYGEFQSNGNHRVALDSFEVIKLVHIASVAAGRMISV